MVEAKIKARCRFGCRAGCRSGCRAKIPKALILRHFSLSDNHDNQYYKEKGNSKKIVSPDKEKRVSEDTLLSAMETAGAEDMPEDAERKGLGTPATCAATLEKLVSAGFVQRKKKQLIPTEKGRKLIAVLPDNIKSPILTAEWESMLKQVEHGELSATSFMDQIADMSRTLVKEHTAPEERFADLFPSSRGTAHEAVGVCPRCGAPVYEGKKGFFCDNRECSFALWKDNRFFSSKKSPSQSLWQRLF